MGGLRVEGGLRVWGLGFRGFKGLGLLGIRGVLEVCKGLCASGVRVLGVWGVGFRI